MSLGSPSGAASVLVTGPAYCDLVFAGLAELPEPGTEVFAPRFLLTAGGSAITAVALARLGRTVGLAADLGDDAFGTIIHDLLEREGVDTTWLRIRAGHPTPVTAVLSTPADRAFVTHLPAASSPLDLADALAGSAASHLHIAGFPVALSTPDAVEIAHRSGATASFDPGWDEMALADRKVRRVAEAVDVLLPNRLEATRLIDRDPSLEAITALQILADARAGLITVVKDGPRGATGSDGHGPLHVDSPVVHAVDPTGAGDVFDAGFLDAWLDGASLEACLRRGTACGAHAVTGLGGAPSAPTRSQLEENA